MAWQNPGLIAIQQNIAQVNEVSNMTGTSSTQPGYEPQNALAYNPSRPLKFTSESLAEKQVVIQLGASYVVDCIAVIEPHTGVSLAVAGDVSVEQYMQFRLEHSTGTLVFDYTHTGAFQDIWGTNFFRSFNSVLANRFVLKVKTQTGNMGSASIGAILLGKKYTFPSNPVISYNRAVVSSSVYTGRPQGPVTTFLRDSSQRTVNVRLRLESEDERIEVERLIAGRGRARIGGGAGEAVRRRLDLPTALVSPDMWVDGTSTYGSCIYGRFVGGLATQSFVGGAAMADLQFQEMV